MVRNKFKLKVQQETILQRRALWDLKWYYKCPKMIHHGLGLTKCANLSNYIAVWAKTRTLLTIMIICYKYLTGNKLVHGGAYYLITMVPPISISQADSNRSYTLQQFPKLWILKVVILHREMLHIQTIIEFGGFIWFQW